jgi:hypothetical protein
LTTDFPGRRTRYNEINELADAGGREMTTFDDTPTTA